MKIQRWLRILLGIVVLTISLKACSGKKYEALQQEVDRVTDDINTVFVQTSNMMRELDAAFEKAFQESNPAHLSVAGMDDTEGGPFAFREQTAYYKKAESDMDNVVLTAFGARPVDDSVRMRLKLLASLGGALRAARQDKRYLGRVTYLDAVYNCALSYPYFDAAYTLPLRWEYESLPWFRWALPENNPERRALWFPEPFIAVGPEGWVLPLFSPVYAGDTLEGILGADIQVYMLGRELLKDTPHKLLLLSGETLVLGSSEAARQELQIREVEDYDYLELLHNNPESPVEFRLTHTAQLPALQELGRRLKQEPEFSLIINGKSYHVFVEKASEVELYVVGLIEQ